MMNVHAKNPITIVRINNQRVALIVKFDELSANTGSNKYKYDRLKCYTHAATLSDNAAPLSKG
jgi:hypothetical protein